MILGHVLLLKMASLGRFDREQLQRSCAKWGHGMGSTRKTTVFQLKQQLGYKHGVGTDAPGFHSCHVPSASRGRMGLLGK